MTFSMTLAVVERYTHTETLCVVAMISSNEAITELK